MSDLAAIRRVSELLSALVSPVSPAQMRTAKQAVREAARQGWTIKDWRWQKSARDEPLWARMVERQEDERRDLTGASEGWPDVRAWMDDEGYIPTAATVNTDIAGLEVE